MIPIPRPLFHIRHPDEASNACKIRHPDRSERTLATRNDLGQLRASEAGTGSKSPPPKKPSAFLADNGGEIRPLGAGVTPAGQLRESEAGTGSSSPHPIFFCHPDRSERTLATRKDLGQLRESEAGTGSNSPHPILVSS